MVTRLDIPKQLAVWFHMHQTASELLHSYLLCTQARDSLELAMPLRLPELADYVEADLSGQALQIIQGGLYRLDLPVVCLNCGERYGTAIGGRVVIQCKANLHCREVQPNESTECANYADILAHSGYPRPLVDALYLTWLRQQDEARGERCYHDET